MKTPDECLYYATAISKLKKSSRTPVCINYYNDGKLISSSKFTKELTAVTQGAINIAMRLILQIHKQNTPYTAYATVTQGKTLLLKFNYPYLFETNEDD